MLSSERESVSKAREALDAALANVGEKVADLIRAVDEVPIDDLMYCPECSKPALEPSES